MDLRHLRSFLALAELRSFKRAAFKRGLSQPGLSKQIRLLEAQLAPLFVRDRSGVSLTPAGEKFLPHAQRIVISVADATKAVRQKGDVRRWGLTVAHTPGHREPAVTVVGTLLRRANEPELKDLRIRVDEMFSPRIEARIADGRLDLGIVDGWSHATGLEHEELSAAPLRLIVHPKRDDLKVRTRIDRMSDLLGETFVLMRPGMRSRSAADDFFARHNFSPKIGVEANSVATVLALVRSIPTLVAILPVPAPDRNELRGLPLLRLPEPVTSLRTFLLWRAAPDQPPVSEAARAFRAELRAHVGLKDARPV